MAAPVPALPAVDGVTHRWVDVDGLRIHVAEAGDGAPVVLLHGWPQHWYSWRRVIRELAPRYRVICPDLRGQGWSASPPGGYDKATLAADLLGLLDALDLTTTALVGHDWGGWVGTIAALQDPERFRCLVAVGIPHPWQRVDARVLDIWRFGYQLAIAGPFTGSLLLRRLPSAVPALIRAGTVRREAFTDADLARYAEPLRAPERARASVALYRTFLTRELPAAALARLGVLRARPSVLDVPGRFVGGDRDPVVTPRLLAGWEGHGHDLGVRIVPRCGHFVPEEAPEAVVAALAEVDRG